MLKISHSYVFFLRQARIVRQVTIIMENIFQLNFHFSFSALLLLSVCSFECLFFSFFGFIRFRWSSFHILSSPISIFFAFKTSFLFTTALWWWNHREKPTQTHFKNMYEFSKSFCYLYFVNTDNTFTAYFLEIFHIFDVTINKFPILKAKLVRHN